MTASNEAATAFGRRLRALRLAAHLSQEGLAERSGVSARTIGNIESGRILRPRAGSLRALADALGLRADDAVVFEAAAWGVRPGSAGEARQGPAPVPAELPADLPDFTGRSAELQTVLTAATGGGGGPGRGIVPVVGVHGRGGVGKTSLLVHAAQLLRDRFPDGQLYANLRGAQPRPEPTGTVLGRFLRSLGVEAGAIPTDIDERAATYRSRLAGRRVLVVLDDVADRSQIEALIPGTEGSAVLVSGRTVASLGMGTTVGIDVLEAEQARRLLAAIVGAERAAAEPEAADLLVRRCGLLPLAIRIVGSRLAGHPHRTLAQMAEALADERRILDELQLADLDVRASIALSYRTLGEREKLAFRLVSVLDAGDFADWAVAALLDTGLREAAVLTDRLIDAQLLQVREQVAGETRYHLHDLLRAYGRERAAELADDVREAAVTRALRAWLWMTEHADRLLPSPGLDALDSTDAVRDLAGHPADAAPAAADWKPDDLLGGTPLIQGRVPALVWFAHERSAILAAVVQGCESGRAELAWRQAHASASYWATQRHITTWRHACAVALGACESAGLLEGQAYMLRGLAQSHIECDELDDAESRLRAALRFYARLGEPPGATMTRTLLGYVRRLQGDPAEARSLLESAVADLERSGLRRLLAYALANLGTTHREQGRLGEARTCSVRALEIYRADGDLRYQAYLARSVGLLEKDEGRPDVARAYFTEAFPLMQELGDRFGEALLMADLGSVEEDPDLAQALLMRAVVMSRESGDGFSLARILYSSGERLMAADPASDLALACLDESLEIWRSIKVPLWEGRTLGVLAAAHAARGDAATERSMLREAIEILDAVGAPESADLRLRLKASAGERMDPPHSGGSYEGIGQ